jgi:hypothetical protein
LLRIMAAVLAAQLDAACGTHPDAHGAQPTVVVLAHETCLYAQTESPGHATYNATYNATLPTRCGMCPNARHFWCTPPDAHEGACVKTQHGSNTCCQCQPQMQAMQSYKPRVA